MSKKKGLHRHYDRLTPEEHFRLDEGVREAIVGAMGKSAPQKAEMPVIALTSATEESPQEERVIGVPWPCETKVLVERIESALLDVPASTIPATQARRE